jgi:hypothetical protein
MGQLEETPLRFVMMRDHPGGSAKIILSEDAGPSPFAASSYHEGPKGFTP